MSEYLEDHMTIEENKNWEEKMDDPLKAFDLSKEEIEDLKKQGRI